MVYQRIPKYSSWNPPSQEKSSQFAPRPLFIQAQQDSHRPPTQEGIENEAFDQNKFEAFGLQLKKESGTITLIEQERLGVLQAKMDDFWAQKLERASQFEHNFANIPVHAPRQEVSAPIQPRLGIQPLSAGLPPQSSQPMIASELVLNHPIQVKGGTIGDLSELSMGLRTNKTGLPEALKAGAENLSGYSLDNVKVHYNSSKPAQLQALAYTQGTDIHVAPGQEKHLPHETWHVVQQMQKRVQPTAQLKGVRINDDEELEREADVMGLKTLETNYPVPRLINQTSTGEVIQLRNAQQRQGLAQNFLTQMGHLNIGSIQSEATLRDHGKNEIQRIPANSVIIYQGDNRDNFGTWGGVEKDHVYAAVVSNANRNFINVPNQWAKGWIVYEKVRTDVQRSTQMRNSPGGSRGVKGRILNYIASITIGGQIPAPTNARVDLAPRALKAWAEKAGRDLTVPMPTNVANDQGVQIDQHLAIDADHNYATIDPQGELNLSRLDPNSQLFQDFNQFLNLNADGMPGTMARDHELRNERTGGARAQLGRQWLESYGKNLTEAEYVAISGADITNIFVNTHCPTWEAYNANVQSIVGRNQINALPVWQPSQTIRGQDAAQDQLIDRMTKDRPGEFYLFHGTSRQNVFNISKTGFDPEYVNYTAVKGYGKTGYGTAFTDQFAKALAYAPPEIIPSVVPGGQPTFKHYVLVAKVFAGNPYRAGDRSRRTRGNLEMTEQNINYEEAKGNKVKSQGEGMPFLGKSSDTVRGLLDRGEYVHSTLQDRVFDLTMAREGAELADLHRQYRYTDTSLTVSDAIQMYPIYIIECTIPADKVRSARR